MKLKTEFQTIQSIQKRRHVRPDGVEVITYIANVGTNPATHKRIRFERNTKKEVIDAVKFFFSTYKAGTPIDVAKDLTPQELADIVLAKEKLKSVGLGGLSFFEIVKDYISRAGAIRRIGVEEAFNLYYDSISPVQKRYRSTVKSRVGAFARAFKLKAVSEITPFHVREYLDGTFGNNPPKTYNNHRDSLKSFFNWCKRRDVGYCTDNPVADIRGKPEVYEEPEFVTADTVRSLFKLFIDGLPKERAAPFVNFFALSFFNGIRSDEIMRLRNKDVNLEEGWIRVAKPKGFQHGMAPRLFQMMPTTMAWLNAFHQGDGDPEKPFIRKFVNPSYPRGYLRILSKKAGTTLELPDNAGRHSFITMHVALENNFAKTESIAGTGRDMREHNYMGLATKKQAEAYFAVTPETMEN